MRILIVDDEPEVARTLAEAIEDQGHQAVLAFSGQEALALVVGAAVNAVFLDLVLPDMSGLEVLKELRANRPTVPVVVITGHASASDVTEASRLGAAEVIGKPLLLNTLEAALRDLRAES